MTKGTVIPMMVTQQGFLDFLGSEGARFAIPAYQRLYSWTDVQCEGLWLDLLRAGRTNKNHFLGTVLYARERGGNDEGTLSIIDGQQRMTSVSLVILALCRYLDAHPAKGPDLGLDADELRRHYLLAAGNEDAGGGAGAAGGAGSSPVAAETSRLIPSRHDLEPYRAELAGSAPGDPTAVVSKNLAFFEDKMRQDGFDPQVLAQGLRRLVVILVEVDDAEAAQSIFESINSKGMPLNVADMVRNYLLLAQTHDEQTRMYEEYWKPSQQMFDPDPGSLKLNAAIKSWISIRLKGARVLSADQVYASFKRYVEDVYQGDKEPILRELRGFCLMWAENYRYHGVKKYRSGSDWAEIGAPTLTAGYELKKADNEEYAENLRKQLRHADSRW